MSAMECHERRQTEVRGVLISLLIMAAVLGSLVLLGG